MSETSNAAPVAAQVDCIVLLRQIADDLESVQRMKAELTRQSNIIAALILAGGGSVTVPQEIDDQVKWGTFCPYSLGSVDGKLNIQLSEQ